MSDDRETKLPQLLYLDDLPYATEEQLQRRRERLAAFDLPDDTHTATTVKQDRNKALQSTLHGREDIMG